MNNRSKNCNQIPSSVKSLWTSLRENCWNLFQIRTNLEDFFVKHPSMSHKDIVWNDLKAIWKNSDEIASLTTLISTITATTTKTTTTNQHYRLVKCYSENRLMLSTAECDHNWKHHLLYKNNRLLLSYL